MTSTFLFSYLPYRAGSNRLLGSGGAAGHAHGGRDGQGGESNGVHGDGMKGGWSCGRVYGNDNGGSPAGTDKGKKRLSDTIAGTDTNGGQAE